MSLREELERIASSAPTADVPPDTWARAQRSNRRVRALTVAAAAAVVALLATTMVWLPDLAPQPAGGDAAPGVPDHIWAVPEHMGARDEYGSWSRDEVSNDLAVGRAAAAYVVMKGLAVVIDADDGDYHLLDLPGFSKSSSLAVSPDGSHLAYGYVDPSAIGVRVVRLDDGAVRDVLVPSRRVGLVVWSSDGRWLAWSGALSPGAGAGRIGPGATTSTALEVPKGAGLHALAVSVDGTVVAVGQRAVLRWEGLRAQSSALSAGPGTNLDGASLEPSGAVASIGSCCTRDAVFVDTVTGNVSTATLSGELRTARPLGWLDDDTSIWQVMPQGAGDDGQLVLVGPDGDTETIGVIDDTVPETLSVAFGLMSPERPTVERAQPSWPWSPIRILVTVVLGATAGVLLLATGWWWRRRMLGLEPQPRSLATSTLLLLGGAVVGAALTVGWGVVATLVVDAPGNDTLLVADLVGVALWCGMGIAATADRRTRAFGCGLVLGPLLTAAVAYVGLLLTLGS